MNTTSLDNARTALQSVKDGYEARVEAATTAQELDTIQGELRMAQAKFDSIQASTEARAANPILQAGGGGDFRVTEPTTYARNNPEVSYFSDLYAVKQTGSPQAFARLQRNNQEVAEARTGFGVEGRAILTTTDFYPPQWLDSLWVTSHRARQVYAGLVSQLDLPPYGETVTIPAYVAPTDAANAQAGDNQSIQTSAGSTTQLTAPIVTYAGYCTVARQAIEGGLPGIDQVIFSDIARDINRKIEIDCLNGNGTNHSRGILQEGSLPAVSVSGQTAAQLLLKLADITQRIEVAVGEPADFILMHPRRFGWLSSLLDDSHRPIVVPTSQGPYNAFGTFSQQQAQDGLSLGPDVKAAGSMLGIPIFTSPSLPTTSGAGTNEDPCVVGVSSLAVRFRDPNGIREFSFEGVDSATGSIRLQGWTYGAYITRYPTAFGQVQGLTTPSF